MRRVKFVLASLFAILCLGWMTGFTPSGSFVAVHAPTGEPAEIDFYGVNFTVPQKDGVLAFPVHHGKARFRAKLSDGRVLWIEFFHADVGARHHVDFYLSHVPDSDLIDVREVIESSHEIFNGNVDANKTSEQQPYALPWV